MRGLLFTLIILGLIGGTSPSAAGDDAIKPPPGGEPAYDGREGGETIADAFVIASLPFEDVGATCDNLHDYDEVCPYQDSQAPDVVYAFTPETVGSILIDLCDSQYDTKLYVYDLEAGYGFGNPLACNDDASCGYSGYQSLCGDLMVHPGHTYYIVIDGYGEACGEYALAVDWLHPCDLTCPAGAMPEGEPPLSPEYEDFYNSGCPYPGYSGPLLVQYLHGDENGELILCGVTGSFPGIGSPDRDTDNFFLFPNGDPMSVTVTSESPMHVFQFNWESGDPCNSVTVHGHILTEACEPRTLELDPDLTPAVWIWATCAAIEPEMPFLYTMEFRGLAGVSAAPGADEPVPPAPISWGQIKGLFRR